MSVVHQLKEAREFLSDPKRWLKGDLFDGNGSVCALGACVTGNASLTMVQANKLLGQYLPGGPDAWSGEELMSVAQYNDDPSTTHQDILNLFDKALADLGGLAD